MTSFKTGLGLALALTLGASTAFAQKAYGPGVTDTEIKFGNTMPYSGPASAYATIGKTEAAYFDMVNANGGINGRRIDFISYDDGYSPPKAVEQARRLVEDDGVLLIFNSLGTPSNSAIERYMNEKKVPQLFVATGATKWNDPRHFPWTMGWQPSYQSEARVYAKYLLRHHPKGRIAILYQNDDYGRAYLTAMTDEMKGTPASIVASEAFNITDPTIDSQIVKLADTKADVLLIGATARQTIQTLKKTAELKWKPQIFIAYPAANIERTYKVAGVDLAKGVISSSVFKDPSDPAVANDKDVKDYFAFMAKYYPAGDRLDTLNVAAYVEGEIMAETLRRTGKDLSHKTFLAKATTLAGFKPPMLRESVVVRTEPSNYTIFRSMQLLQFDGKENKAIATP